MRSIVLEVSSGQNVFQRSRIPIRVTNGASTKVRVAPNSVPLYRLTKFLRFCTPHWLKKEKISVCLITTAHMYGTVYADEAVYVYMHRHVHLCF